MGSFTPSLVVPRVAVCKPSSCSRIAPPVCTSRGQMRPQKCAAVFRQDRFAHEPRFSDRTHAGSVASSNGTTIASMMLAPCSASSMLSASLRPGPWPGLRALTTPARGTHWQLRDDGHLMTVHNDLDANNHAGVWCSHHVSVARHSSGFATTASGARIPPTAPKGTAWSASLTTSQPVAGSPTTVDLHTVGREHHGFSRRRVLRITRRNKPAFTWA